MKVPKHVFADTSRLCRHYKKGRISKGNSILLINSENPCLQCHENTKENLCPKPNPNDNSLNKIRKLITDY